MFFYRIFFLNDKNFSEFLRFLGYSDVNVSKRFSFSPFRSIYVGFFAQYDWIGFGQFFCSIFCLTGFFISDDLLETLQKTWVLALAPNISTTGGFLNENSLIVKMSKCLMNRLEQNLNQTSYAKFFFT